MELAVSDSAGPNFDTANDFGEHDLVHEVAPGWQDVCLELCPALRL